MYICVCMNSTVWIGIYRVTLCNLYFYIPFSFLVLFFFFILLLSSLFSIAILKQNFLKFQSFTFLNFFAWLYVFISRSCAYWSSKTGGSSLRVVGKSQLPRKRSLESFNSCVCLPLVSLLWPTPDRVRLRKERFILAHSSKGRPFWQRRDHDRHDLDLAESAVRKKGLT